MKNIFKLLALVGITSLFVAYGQSDGLAGVVNQGRSQFNAVVDIISTVSYIVGVGLLFKAILKFKESNESKGQVPISNAIVLFICAGLCLGLPYLYSVSGSSVLGGGSTRTGILNGQLQNVN